jgi:DNA gyrase inhibitor GyrI
MQLNDTPEIVNWPETRYIFVEKKGAFLDTAPQAWRELRQMVPEISAHTKINGYLTLYKLHQQIYRAGVSVSAEPAKLPEGLRYEVVKGGTYSRFVLTGGHSNLPRAYLRTFAIVSEKKIRLREDYNIENYVNDPRLTPPDRLITEILYPTA